jgi:hypothetical protein
MLVGDVVGSAEGICKQNGRPVVSPSPRSSLSWGRAVVYLRLTNGYRTLTLVGPVVGLRLGPGVGICTTRSFRSVRRVMPVALSPRFRESTFSNARPETLIQGIL